MRGLMLLGVLFYASAALSADPAPTRAAQAVQFNTLLEEAQLRFQPLADAEAIAPVANVVMPYEHGMRSADGLIEVRYAIRPIERLQIEYDDPHGSAPDPNHIFPLIFESLAVRLSGGTHTPTQEYPQDRAQKKFNADWAAAAVFDIKSEFGTAYKQGLLLAMHRNRVADAYVVVLFDDFEQVRAQVKTALRSMTFSEPADEQPDLVEKG